MRRQHDDETENKLKQRVNAAKERYLRAVADFNQLSSNSSPHDIERALREKSEATEAFRKALADFSNAGSE